MYFNNLHHQIHCTRICSDERVNQDVHVCYGVDGLIICFVLYCFKLKYIKTNSPFVCRKKNEAQQDQYKNKTHTLTIL